MIEREIFGQIATGESVDIYTLENKQGVRVRIMTLGATIVSLEPPDRHGNTADIVLGFETPQGYLTTHQFYGAVIGRYANRIAGGRLPLDGEDFVLPINNGPNHLHGGENGFDQRIWHAETFERDGQPGLALSLVSPDGDQGYPGTLAASVRYMLDDGNRLVIDYEATTDKPTVVNLTQHPYFNLDGHAAGDILAHDLQIFSDAFTPINGDAIPTGERLDVAGTEMDFRTEKPVGRDIDLGTEQLRLGSGFDHNWILRKEEGADHSRSRAARLTSPASGRTLTVYTTEPGMQFYTGNFLRAGPETKDSAVYGPRSGLCLETQHFPNSPNEPSFPSTRLDPGEVYRSQTIFEFGLAD